ncbi:hypothetical protein [Mycobacterium avium]|uniref:hypothetical protein n=1 Tax=Mycobacterium avium TaxID=1764 RepID=UPI000B4A5E7A|nr:hypothetical protein [Mycobacterium avium]QBC87402.1 hypothetical protein B6K05_023555 [Mycobacterium avium subsp. hominissuis]
MSTFTAVGNWSAQGVVEGVVTFTPRPAAAGTPVQANITASVLNVSLPVIDGAYLVEFSAVTLDGELGTIESFVFPSPAGGSVNLNTLVAPAPTVTVGPTSFPPANELSVSALGAQLVEAQTPRGARQLIGAAAAKTYFVDDYGADPTGATSSDAAVAAAMAAMGASPGILAFGPGTYRLSETMTFTHGDQGVIGQGIPVTTLNWVGTGDCIRMYDPTTGTFPSKTGLIAGFKIQGYNAGANSTGIHVGDTYNLRIRDLWITDFVANGSIGALFDNTVTITERARVEITIDNCSTAVVFQVEDPETPSFDYSDWDFIINCFANQNGVVIKGSAQIIHGSLRIRGDCYNTVMNGPYQPESGWSAASTNTGVLLTVGTGSGTPYLEQVNLVVAVECAGIPNTAPCHATINIGAGADIWCTGILSFRFDEGFAWTPGTNHGWFAFAGYRNVDSTYGVETAPQTFSVNGAVTTSAGNASGAELQLNSSNIIQYLLAPGVNALTFNYAGMSGAAAWDIVLQQPASADATVTLPSNFHVMPSYGSVSLTAVAYAQNLFRLITYDMSVFYLFPVA